MYLGNGVADSVIQDLSVLCRFREQRICPSICFLTSSLALKGEKIDFTPRYAVKTHECFIKSK